MNEDELLNLNDNVMPAFAGEDESRHTHISNAVSQDGGFYSQWAISHTPRYIFMWTYELQYLQFLVIDVGQMNLAQYIREVALLTGTKVSCGEGGCGACIVTVNKEGKSRSVNSVRCFYRK